MDRSGWCYLSYSYANIKKIIVAIKDLATKADLQKECAELRKDLRKSKNEIFKWMLAFCIGDIAATTAIMLLIAK